MKRIIKGAEPPSLVAFKTDNAEVRQNLRYAALSGVVKDQIKAQMLQEQGFLCAYTMQRLIDGSQCHIEHVIPQSQSRDRQIDYSNMFACFPPGRSKESYPYGASAKGGKHVTEANFVSPITEDVEARFQYKYDGSVNARQEDLAAVSTIKMLGLNHGSLKDIRRAAIEAAGVSRFGKDPLSPDAARQLAEDILLRDAQGRFAAFCVSIAQVAVAHADREEQPYLAQQRD